MWNRKTEIRNQNSGIGNKLLFSFLIAYFCFISGSSAQDTMKESLSELSRMLPPKKVVSIPWGKDPFAPLVSDASAKQGSLRLTAIIYNEKKPSAIINSRILYIGDTLDGQKVIDITKQYVILRDSSGSYKLGIDSAVGQSYDIKKSQ
ncbi:MAG: hypothetical protein HY026_02455 [Deltaproteobacteria bacterium]|nr:hypothetical protein [Deltaproteobacteria bacterium]